MFTFEAFMQKKCLQKQVKKMVKTCSTWAEVPQRLEKTFPVYETDLSVRTQIGELPMLHEFPSAPPIAQYVCDQKRFLVCSHLYLFLEYVFENLADFAQLNMQYTQW